MKEISPHEPAEDNLASTDASAADEAHHAFAELSPDGIFIEADGQIVYTNAAALKLLGAAAADELLGHSPLEFVLPRYQEPTRQRLVQGMKVMTIPAETGLRHRDGTTLLTEMTAGPVVWKGKQAVQVLVRDVTRYRQAEEALRTSEAKYRSLFHAIDEGFCIFKMIFDEHDTPIDYRFLESNPTFEQQTGLRNAIGKTARELVPDLDESWFRLYGNVALTGESTRFENHAPAMGRWFDVFAFRFGKPEERQVALLFKDITKSKEAEAALRESEQRFRTLADTAPAMLWITDTENRCTFLSRGWYEYTGQTEEEALGFGWIQAVHPEDREEARRIFLNRDENPEILSCDYRLRRYDGEYRWAIDSARPRFDAGGEWLGYIGSVIDVHERKIAADALRKLEVERHLQDQLEAERQRIGRELHDTVRQQLTGMRMLAGSIHKRLKEHAPAEARLIEEFVDVLTDTNLQVRELITGLLPAPISGAHLPAALEREARNIERWYGVLCDMTVPEQVPLVSDEVADHLFYVAREALTNAAKHGKAATIRLDFHTVDSSLVLCVQDDGVGLPPEYEQAGGTGISSMRHRTELIGATLTVTSNGQTGTTVTCTLPLSGRRFVS